MPDCQRCRCPLADDKWLEHPSLEHCVKALGKKVNPEEPPRRTLAGWPQGATRWSPDVQERLRHARYCLACADNSVVCSQHEQYR